MPFTGVYPVEEPIFARPKQFATIERFNLPLPGLLPEAQEAASFLLNISQLRAENNTWVWISQDYILTTLHQDLLAYSQKKWSSQLTSTYELPKKTHLTRFLDMITGGWYSMRYLLAMQQKEPPQPLSADRGEDFFKKGLYELVHAGLARRMQRTTEGGSLTFYAPTARLIGMLQRWEASHLIPPPYSS